MENIINSLLDLPDGSFLVYCIKNSIRAKMEAAHIIGQIKSQADDNPTMMKTILGKDLFNQIQNVAV